MCWLLALLACSIILMKSFACNFPTRVNYSKNVPSLRKSFFFILEINLEFTDKGLIIPTVLYSQLSTPCQQQSQQPLHLLDKPIKLGGQSHKSANMASNLQQSLPFLIHDAFSVCFQFRLTMESKPCTFNLFHHRQD